jgi:hypothetical protein
MFVKGVPTNGYLEPTRHQWYALNVNLPIGIKNDVTKMPAPKDPLKKIIWQQNLSNSHKGKPTWNKGKTTPEETRLKLKIARNKRPPCSEETKQKMSASLKGKKQPPRSENYRKKMSDSKKKAYQENPDLCKKLSDIRVGRFGGENHPNWQGGKSFFPYCYKFNDPRKRAARKFFNDICLCCGSTKDENIIAGKTEELGVHHIDHDKEQGCSGKPFNLVPLCRSCHSKEGYAKKEYQHYINNTLREGFKWSIWSESEYKRLVMY